MPLSLLVVAAILVAGLVVAIFLIRRRSSCTPYPPGPLGDPIIGNLRQLPGHDAAIVFEEMGKKFGDVICLRVLGSTIVVLNSLQAAEELLDKHSAIHSDRPVFTLYELFGFKNALSAVPYGKQLMRLRQAHHSYLNKTKTSDLRPMLTVEARTLGKNLLECKEGEHELMLNRFSTGVIAQVVSGHRIVSAEDNYLRMSKMVLHVSTLMEQVPAVTPLDFLPFLKHFPGWFPGAHYAGFARQWRPVARELYTFPLETVKQQRKDGSAMPSFLLEQLEFIESTPKTEEGVDLVGELEANAASMFAAGEATTWSALSVFLLAMTLYPQCQARAQTEIDAVIGNRLPEFQDRESLPYVECLYNEVFRWNTGAPLGMFFNGLVSGFDWSGIPHRSISDDIYRGMFIPKGTTILPNIRAMSHDERIYRTPTLFDPTRYLPAPEGRGEPFFTGKYGFGRRWYLHGPASRRQQRLDSSRDRLVDMSYQTSPRLGGGGKSSLRTRCIMGC
ncbi:Cytochrome P450 [Mycena indigotica]|uniref:Cytochrome P450 n=1 Tax=Mycena indigotica TaxID=2126181 RepID=A0A8H6SQI5_9AGAR|nr:Cytochrome P450 [Mycena indigotica]KAF7303973.1 Cytochrome P450 [Mycena indigotica]